MITVSECVEIAALREDELILGVAPSARHYLLLSSYMLNIGRGPAVVRRMIVSDFRDFLALGATRRAADLLVVLRLFLSSHREGRRSPFQLGEDGQVIRVEGARRFRPASRGRDFSIVYANAIQNPSVGSA